MPVLVHGAFVLEREDIRTVTLALTRDVETFVTVLHDAIADQAPVLMLLVFEWHHVNLCARI